METNINRSAAWDIEDIQAELEGLHNLMQLLNQYFEYSYKFVKNNTSFLINEYNLYQSLCSVCMEKTAEIIENLSSLQA